ncbi:MAG: flavin-containing monooxygenase [Flavobacteriaceae bacterium]
MSERTDIIIVGAGLSGIGAACHLERLNPDKSYRVLEARSSLGGTWSLFKYPGIRSDSDMYTFGYSFKTWENPKSFADAPSILSYLREAVDEYQLEDKIQYQTKLKKAHFDTSTATWELQCEHLPSGDIQLFTSKYLFICTGYYNYTNGYTPSFVDSELFTGKLIHPQHWPEDLDYQQKKVVVIGSGATAVTIVPKMAEKAQKVSMLQRSPTYVGAFPNRDSIALSIKKILPQRLAHKVIRLKNISTQILFFQACKIWPKTLKKLLVKGAQKQLGDFPAQPHFEPHYNPWDQRFCVAPDGDLFAAIRSGKADVVTATIDRFVPEGILLTSGEKIEADIIVTATGLQLLAFGGAEISVDDTPFDMANSLAYRGLMLSNLPNCIFFAGYTNASWTLKSDLTSAYASRILKYMDRKKFKLFYPKVTDKDLKTIPLLNLNSGYIHRAEHLFPKQGDAFPWRLYQNYFRDFWTLRVQGIDDPQLQFRS